MKDMPILQNIKLVKIDSNTKEVIKDKFTLEYMKMQNAQNL